MNGNPKKIQTTLFIGSPIESTTYKFAKCLQDRFGIIEGITDKEYTDSFFSQANISLDEKLKIESNYHGLCNGGHELILNKNEVKSKKSFFAVINKLIEKNIGYVSFK